MLRVPLLALVLPLALVRCDQAGPPTPPDPPVPGTTQLGCDGQMYPALSETPYVLPFPVGTGYRMNLGNCSSSFHGPDGPDRYAYDFVMPIGTLLTAARAGLVVHVEESGRDGGFPNNLVVVDHGDGTFAQYMHLTQNGAEVGMGDRVEQGDRIGRSGNTGLAGRPHLHFIVTRGGWRYPYNPIPASFGNASPRDLVLKQDETYHAESY